MNKKDNIISAFFNNNFNTLNDASSIVIFNLILYTIVFHFLFWLFAIDSIGVLEKIYVYSNRLVEQRWLFYPFYDGSYVEHFQVIILFWNFLLTSYIVIKSKWKVAFGIPIIWLLVLIDDFFALHDNVLPAVFIDKLEAFPLINKFELIRIDDIAEILFWLFFLIFVILILLIGLLSKIKNIRKFIYINIFYYFLIAVPGIFIDVLQVNIIKFFDFNKNILFLTGIIFNTIEEFGEIFFISLAFIYFYKITSNIVVRSIRIGNLID